MNLKEAFRFQNKLQSMMDEAQSILGSTANITKVQNTYLRKKVMPEAENETTIDAPATEYSEQITLVAEFLLHLLSELVNTQVEYTVPFDVNATFAEAFEIFAGDKPDA